MQENGKAISMKISERCRQVLSPNWQLTFANTDGDIRQNSVLTISQLIENYGLGCVKIPFMEALKEFSDFFNADFTVSQCEQFFLMISKEKTLTISDFSRFLGLLKIGKIAKPQFGKVDIPFMIEKINTYRLVVAENNHKFDEQYKKQKESVKMDKKTISYEEWVRTRNNTPENPVVFGYLAKNF